MSKRKILNYCMLLQHNKSICLQLSANCEGWISDIRSTGKCANPNNIFSLSAQCQCVML